MANDNNKANMMNRNKGTSGVNKQNAQREGNRGKQLNPIRNNSNTPKGGKKNG